MVSGLLCGIGDAFNGVLQRIILGETSNVFVDKGFWGSEEPIKELYKENPVDDKLESNIYIVQAYVKSWLGGYGVPNIKLTPAEIFAGNVPALNANFFVENDANQPGTDKSIVSILKPTISAWYIGLRNIAIVGLLSVLLYIGIRIVISSSAGEKAKYKQFFFDWVISLCLIFFLHYIMAFTMVMVDTITDVLGGQASEDGVIKQCNVVFTDPYPVIDKDTKTMRGSPIEGAAFSTNFTGVARLKAQYDDNLLAFGYTILYLALTVYTVYFTFIYLKRLLMLSFFTIIAPLVALSYPLDKMKDSKAQAFNFWLKEYIFYAMLQPLHMLLYTVFVSSALNIASKNMIYAIVALAFIVPAEKIVKQMFGIRGATESSLGAFAGGALASQMFSKLARGGKGNGGKRGGAPDNNRIREARNPDSPSGVANLAGEAEGLNGLPDGNDEIRTTEPQNNQDSKDNNENYKPLTPNSTPEGEEEENPYETGHYDVSGMGEGQGEQEEEWNPSMSFGDPEADDEYQKEQLKEDYKPLMSDSAPEEQTPGTSQETGEDERFRRFEELKKSGMSDRRAFRAAYEEPGRFAQYGRTLSNNFKTAVGKRYRMAGGARGIAKSVGMATLKGGLRAASMLALGGAGLAIGTVGGDLGDTLKGLGAGLVAGNEVGRRASNTVDNTLHGRNAVGNFVRDVALGDKENSRRQYIADYVNSRETRSRIMEKNPSFTSSQVRERQRQEATIAYDAGLKDYSKIKAAVKMEDELMKTYGGSDKGKSKAHDMTIELAKLEGEYSSSEFTNPKKYKEARDGLAERFERQMLAGKQGENIDRRQRAMIQAQAGAEADIAMKRIRTMKGL